MLKTFCLQYKKDILATNLVTIRNYGEWFLDTFDDSICKIELFTKSKEAGSVSFQYHPGTKIGKWFDGNKSLSKSIYIKKGCSTFSRLCDLGMIKSNDVTSKIIENEKVYCLRVYSVKQLDLYIKCNIDKDFNLYKYVGTPTQIKVHNTEGIIMPDIGKDSKRKLF